MLANHYSAYNYQKIWMYLVRTRSMTTPNYRTDDNFIFFLAVVVLKAQLKKCEEKFKYIKVKVLIQKQIFCRSSTEFFFFFYLFVWNNGLFLGSGHQILPPSFQVVDSEDLENLQFSLPANSSRYIEVNKSIRFLVSLETATRQDTVLVVNFGDGIVGTFSLDATNTSAISDCSEPVFLLKDYGESCQLFGEICYVYTKPGYFKPQILAKNNISSISQALNVQIVVHEKPTTTKIVSKNFIATNMQAFFIVISPLLTNVTFVSWSIKSENKVILNQTGFAQLMHIFSKKGHYEITAVFENSEKSMEKAQKIVVIREAIGKVLLQQLTSYLLKVGECLTFHAEVLTGNQVNFVWNIAGEVYSTQGNLTSSRSYVFHTPGRYNISVSAYNEVSNITKFLPQEVVVQQPIEFLELLLNEVLPHDSSVLLCVRVIRGSDVSLWWDFGTSWQNPDIVLRNESKLCIEHRFPYLGFVNITVMAVNEVSNVTETCEVLIEAPVTTIDLHILRPTAVGIPIIFSAKTNGKSTTFLF